jgi:hypothetical protein
MSTRRDYIGIAEALAAATTHVNDYGMDGVRIAAEHIAAYLASRDARFNVERFLKNCGVDAPMTATEVHMRQSAPSASLKALRDLIGFIDYHELTKGDKRLEMMVNAQRVVANTEGK